MTVAAPYNMIIPKNKIDLSKFMLSSNTKISTYKLNYSNFLINISKKSIGIYNDLEVQPPYTKF